MNYEPLNADYNRFKNNISIIIIIHIDNLLIIKFNKDNIAIIKIALRQ